MIDVVISINNSGAAQRVVDARAEAHLGLEVSVAVEGGDAVLAVVDVALDGAVVGLLPAAAQGAVGVAEAA